MTNLTAQTESRTYHSHSGGKDANPGTTYNLAFRVAQSAVDACNALVPPPSLAATAAAVNVTGGSEAGTVSGLTSIIGLFSGITFQGGLADAVTVTMGSFTNFTCITATNAAPSGIAFLCDGELRTGLDYKFASATGTGTPVSIKVTGASDFVFTNGGQIATAAGGIGLLDDATSSTVVVHNVNIVTLDGNSGIGVKIGSPGSFKEFNFSSIVETGAFTGTTGLQCVDGTVSGRGTSIDADTAIDVLAGSATWDIARVTGDINIAVGAQLDCSIIKYTGSVSNSGLLNGRIGSVLYGTWITGANQFLSNTNVHGKVKESLENYGSITIDGAVDTIDSIRVSYLQDTTSSRTVDFQLIDADTSVVYLSGTSPAQTSIATFFFDVPVASPGFPLSTVNLIIQLEASGSKVEEGNVSIYLTRP